jgi:hypothetical protein
VAEVLCKLTIYIAVDRRAALVGVKRQFGRRVGIGHSSRRGPESKRSAAEQKGHAEVHPPDRALAENTGDAAVT